MKTKLTRFVLVLSAALALRSAALAIPMPLLDEEGVAESMRAAALQLLESLDAEQTEKVQKPFREERKDWHFVPKARDGLSLKEISEEQESLVFALLRQGLAEQGFKKVEDVISLELVLRELEGPRSFAMRDPELYYVWIFGDPNEEAWGWRFEGHHVSVNATIVNGAVSMTPTFLGANPARVPSGPREGFRALASEEDNGFRFVESLTESQREKAVFETRAPRDIFSFADRKTKPLPIEGIAYAELTAEQQTLLKELVDVFLRRNRPEIYDDAIALIERGGWPEVSFGWAGPIDRSEGNYYFVQGPGFLIEYDNTQNDNNHIHSVWREFDGDFGEDLLRRHRESHAH